MKKASPTLSDVRIVGIDIDDVFIANALSLEGASDFVIKSNRGGWQSELCNYTMYPWAQPVLDQVLKAVNKPQREMTYWFNINGQDHYNEWHDHDRGTGGELCGCLYAVAPEGCGAIEFAQPYAGTIQYQPKRGMFVIFPDQLMHRVLPNQGEVKRLSIAFNFWRMIK